MAFFAAALLFLVLPPIAGAESLADSPSTQGILDKYVNATKAQQPKLRDVSMEVDIEASLPRLHKKGKLHALRLISKLGEITYKAIKFDGDKTIKNDVIARYLAAETKPTEGPSLAITPENYKFKYRGIVGEGWDLHLFELTPKEKRVGLFRGWIWLEANSCLPVREVGEFVKNPSVFLKKVSFVRDYEIQDGAAIPKRIVSTVETRLVGKAELKINFSNFARGDAKSDAKEVSVLSSGDSH